MRKTNRGFTLIEAMVVVVIIAIMASIGIPSYRQYMMRAQRADGTGALLRMASAQEKFYLQNNRYAGAGEMAPAPPGGLGIPGTEHGYYNLAVAPAAWRRRVRPWSENQSARCGVNCIETGTDREIKQCERQTGDLHL